MTFHWRLINLPGTTYTLWENSLSHSRQTTIVKSSSASDQTLYPSICFILEFGLLGFYRSCAYCCKHCEFVCTVVLRYPENCFLVVILLTFGSYTVPITSSAVINEPWEEYTTHVLFNLINNQAHSRRPKNRNGSFHLHHYMLL